MPKLLQINVSANFGSTGKIAESIGIAAINHGWESYIAFRRNFNPSKSKLIQVSGKYGKHIHYLGNYFFDKEGLYSCSDTKRLIKRIDKIKPDIVHLHNIHDHWLNYKILFEYLNNTDIKVVWTFHDCWAFTGHCFHFVTKDCQRWKTGCHDCPLQHEYPKTLVDRSKKNYALKKKLFGGCKNLTIVPCSDWMGNFVRDSFLRDKKIRVIKNGIDLNAFKPSSSSYLARKDTFNVIAVSNVWTKEKGFEDIFQLREMLSEEYVITIVGLSEEQTKILPKGITGIQRTKNVQELVELYRASDVLINPTYADTFPTVNLEALACGIPVITYRTGGSPESVDKKTGLVIKQGDVKELSSAIMHLKKNPLSSEDCRKRAETFFDKEKCFEEYVRLYEELLEQ